MELKTFLTNEKIRKKFKSQFDLVNYAIRLAENMIKTGREPRVFIDSKNRALQVVSEIVHNKDQFDEVAVNDVLAVSEVHNTRHFERNEEKSASKDGERKKNRKILGN